MAKTGGAIAKLQLKATQRATAHRKGTAQSIVSRIAESYQGGKHGRFIAMAEHRRRMRGVISQRSGEYIVEPIPVVAAVTFRGDGLPNEGYDIGEDGKFVGLKPAKTNAERAAADKRAPLKSEMKDGWRPRRWKKYA